MTDSAFLALLVSLTCAAAAPNSTAELTRRAVVESVQRLHNRNWRGIAPENVESLVGIHFSSEDAAYPTESNLERPCKPALYMYAGDETRIRLSLEFQPVQVNRTCVRLLDGVAVNGVLTNNEAELLRGAFLEAIKPGGHPQDVNSGSQYVWRSKDSHKRFELFMSVRPRSPDATPETATDFKLVLKHDDVKPSDVDDLPFEKGVMLKCP